MNRSMVSKAIERCATLRRAWGEFLMQTARGFELATGGITLYNALLTSIVRSDGSAFASFLKTDGALAFPPTTWAALFGALGLFVLGLFFSSSKNGGLQENLALRALTMGALSCIYVCAAFAVLGSSDPPAIALRYGYTGALTLCCTALFLRLACDAHQKKFNCRGAL